MRKITDFIVKFRNIFLIIFIGLSIFSLYLSTKVNINEDIMKYLPKNSETKIGKDINDQEFEELDSSNLNVMFKNLSEKEKKSTLKKLEKVKGVSSVTYEDNKNYNKGKHTLYVLNVNDYAKSKTTRNVYDYVRNHFNVEAMSGSIYDEYKPVLQLWIVILAIACAMLILILLSESYIEPFLYLISIGIAVFINKGSNIMFSSVSSITNSIVAILQLALSMDYSIMLSNRFKQEKRKTDNKVEGMKNALYHSFSSISSSSVTTIVGLLALVFMSFTIGKDLGFVLAKGVLLSLVSIFCCLPSLLLIFDNLIAKTQKKHLNFNLTKLGKFSYLTRYIQTIIVIALFIIAYFLKGNINILYTGHEQDEVGKVFPANNQIAIIYKNKNEKFISEYCKSLEEDKKINQILCYGNTLSEKLTYDKLNDKFSELGENVKIDETLLRIIYYNYFNKNNEVMSLTKFVNFVQNDIYGNKNFGKNIDQSTKDNISKLSNFIIKDKMNKSRNIDELSELLSIDKDDLEKIMILYNSKNINSTMTIKTFINFLLNNVANSEEYRSYLDDETKAKLNQLKVFTDKNTINKNMSSKELSKLFSIDESLVKKLLLLYNITNESKTKLSLNEFATFALELSNYDDYKNMFNDESKSKLNLLKQLTTKEVIDKDLDQSSMVINLNALGISVNDDVIEKLYVLYNGNISSSKISLNTFAKTALSLSSDDNYKSYFSDEMINKLKNITFLSDNANNIMTNNNLYDVFSISDDKKQKINYAITGDVNGTYNLTPLDFVNTLLNNEAIKNELSETDISSLSKAQFIMNNKDKTFSNSEVLSILDLKSIVVDMIYGAYEKKTNNISNISIKNLINYLYKNKDNELISSYISTYNELIITAHNVINTSDKKFSFSELSKVISFDKNALQKIYGIYDFLNSDTKLSPYIFVDFIVKNKNNDLLKGKISNDKVTLLNLVNEVMKSTINNKKYTSKELSKLIGIDKNKIDIVYSLYNSYNNKNNEKISVYKLVNFIKDNVMNNKDYAANFNDEKRNKINKISLLMNNALNNKNYSSNELYNDLSVFSNNLDKSLIELVYIYYGSVNNYDKSWSLTIEQLISYVNSSIISDNKFNKFISSDMKNKIKLADQKINKSKKLLVSEKYSRMILNTSYEFENKETYNFIKKLKNDFKDKDGIYVVGNSPMAVEMSKTFNNELNKITILTMIFIFVVVALTFKDLIIPFILVLIIQTAVYITMSAISLTGGNVYFISLIIVQAILMGATIDYAIVYTSYYRESREKHDIRTSIIKAYNKSIHTIISSSSILIIVTLVVSNFASAIAAKICETISQGTLASTILILLVLPGTLAASDKLICRGKKYRK